VLTCGRCPPVSGRARRRPASLQWATTRRQADQENDALSPSHIIMIRVVFSGKEPLDDLRFEAIHAGRRVPAEARKRW
jgi:hypothetical protein